jgi:hypothetical protein
MALEGRNTEGYNTSYQSEGNEISSPPIISSGTPIPSDPHNIIGPYNRTPTPTITVPPKTNTPVISPPPISNQPSPCLDLHTYGYVLWENGFQWKDEVLNFVSSPAVTRIAAFDDLSLNTLVNVKNDEFSYNGKRYRVVCTGYYINDYLCDVAAVSYSTLSSHDVSFAKYSIPKLNGEFYITSNGKLCKLEEVSITDGKTPNLGDDMVTPPSYQPPQVPPAPPKGSGQVYGNIYSDEVINDIKEIETRALWTEGSNLKKHFISGSDYNTTSDYYMEVWSDSPEIPCSKVQYKIIYADYSGGGAIDYGGLDHETMTKAMYSQYSNILLNAQTKKFVIDNEEQDYVYIIDVKRDMYDTSMDPGNWELNLGSINSSATTGSSTLNSITFNTWPTTGRYIDSTVTSSRQEVHLSNKTYDVVQGNLEDGITMDPSILGLFYPNHGVIVLSGQRLDSLYGFNTNRNIQKNGSNPYRLFTSISGASAPDTYFDASGDPIGFKGRKLIIRNSKYIFVRIKNQLFNYTNNPSYTTGDDGTIKPEFIGQETVYITSIGLYNNQKELMAVAKLSAPYKKNPTEEALFTVRVSQ